VNKNNTSKRKHYCCK